MPIAALSTSNKIGLAAAGAFFIVFSLISALVIPRWRPDFPGRGLGLYVPAALALFVGMMAAVFVFGQEEEHEAAETPAAETGREQPPTGGETTAAPEGDAAAGEQVFATAGCGSCHTFEAAGTSGTTGPDLDEALQGEDAAFIRESIVDPNAEIAEGFQPDVMPQTYGDQLSEEELDDLVAFLQQ